jgi:hypothetical protein
MPSVAFLLPRPNPLAPSPEDRERGNPPFGCIGTLRRERLLPSPRAGREGQPIATRVDGTLYYVHADPAHTMLSVSDVQGSSQGHRHFPVWWGSWATPTASACPLHLLRTCGIL